MDEAEVKEIIQDYVLICYDIPASEGKLRKRFLREAHSIGAIGYTQSVYLIPYSDKAFDLANNLAAKGNAIVFRSNQANEKKALEITVKYEHHLQARCDLIAQRLVIGQEYITAGKLGMAKRVGIKTGRLLQELFTIAETFSPVWLMPRIAELVIQWKVIYGEQEETI